MADPFFMRLHNREPTLLIDDAGIGALAAAMALDDPSRAVAWVSTRLPEGLEAAAAVVRRKSEAVGLGGVRVRAEWDDDGPLSTTRLLLDAVDEARAASCAAVLWPVHYGHDLDAVSQASDRLRLVNTLALLELGQAAPRVEAPLLDFTDAEVAELALDVEAPLDAGLWLTDDPARWAEAFNEARARRASV